MQALIDHGFTDVATDFQKARELMFGDVTLTEDSVMPVISRLLEEDTADRPILDEISRIHDRLITRLPDVLDVRNRIGLENHLFEDQR